jgi:hypothetical protein
MNEMSDTIIIGILTTGLILAVILSVYQDNKIKRLEIENEVLKERLKK